MSFVSDTVFKSLIFNINCQTRFPLTSMMTDDVVVKFLWNQALWRLDKWSPSGSSFLFIPLKLNIQSRWKMGPSLLIDISAWVVKCCFVPLPRYLQSEYVRMCVPQEIVCTLRLSQPVPSINVERGVTYQHERFVFLLTFWQVTYSHPLTG